MDRSTQVPLGGVTSFTYDERSDILYLTSQSGFVERWSVASGTLLPRLNIGGSLSGADLSADGRFLLVGQSTPTGSGDQHDYRGQATVHRINLADLTVQNLNFAIAGYERGAFDVVVAADDTAFVTTNFAGSGWTPFRTFSASSAGFQPTQVTGLREVRQSTFLVNSENDRYVLIAESNISNAPLHLYDSNLDRIVASTSMNGFNNGRMDVSEAAGLVVNSIYNELKVFNLNLGLVQNLSHLSQAGSVAGVQFSDDGRQLFIWEVNADDILVYDTASWRQVATLDVRSNVGFAANGVPFGDMTTGDDGRLLFLDTENGFEVIDLAERLVLNLTGTAGADRLFGAVGRDTLSGGAGDDLLVGGGGADLLRGDGGADLIGGQDGDDFVDGGAGGDALYGDAGRDTLVGGADGDRLHGQDGDDLIGGQDGDDYVDGGAGRDRLYGDDGADLIVGGSDDDFLDGQTGEDLIGGQDGDDVVVGGAGRDRLYGDAGDDLIGGQDDDDFVDGGAGRDRLYGDAGRDLVVGGTGDDFIDGGAGDDLVGGQDGNDLIIGGGDRDQLYGDAGDDLIGGQDGDDFVDGGLGNDALYGDAGDDELVGGAGDDRIDGGGGIDTALFSGRRADYVVTTSNGVTTVQGADGVDTLVSVEVLRFADGSGPLGGSSFGADEAGRAIYVLEAAIPAEPWVF